jgi:hypothetical protein
LHFKSLLMTINPNKCYNIAIYAEKMMRPYVYILAAVLLCAIIVGCYNNKLFMNSYHVQNDVTNKERVTAVVR